MQPRELLPLLGLLLAACSGGSENTPSATNAPASAPSDAGVGVGSEARETNSDPNACGATPGGWDEGIDPPAYCVKTVGGVLEDTGGKPLSGVAVSVCGRACFTGKTDATGAFRIAVGAKLPDGQYAFFAHARPAFASVLVPLPSGPPERLDFALPITLPALSEASTPLPSDNAPASKLAVGPLTFDVPADVTWELSIEDAADPAAGRTVRYATVSPARAASFVKDAALVYALAPFEAKASKKVSVSIAETGGLTAGTPVELFVMGGLSLDEPETTGRALLEARGHVSADGTRITTDPGEGISRFTWLAVRAVP